MCVLDNLMKGVVYVAISVSFSEENTLSNDLWHKRELMDVVFRVGGREFPAHRTVLVSVQAKRYAQWGTVIVIYYRGQSGDRNAIRL